jgi:hypothetical protein
MGVFDGFTTFYGLEENTTLGLYKQSTLIIFYMPLLAEAHIYKILVQYPCFATEPPITLS